MTAKTMNSRELLYLASVLGVSEFPCIPDGFYGMDDAEIKLEILKTRDNLTGRGYATADFDGNFTPEDEIARLINACAVCDKYISVQCSVKGESPRAVYYYLKENELIKIAQSDKENYSIEQTTPAQVKSEILNGFSWTNGAAMDERVTLTNRVLRQVKSSADNEFDDSAGLNILKQSGASDNMAKIIFDGLCERANYFSVTVADRTPDGSGTSYTAAINTADGSFELLLGLPDPEESPDDGFITFKPIDFEGFRQKIEKVLCQAVSLSEDGDFV